MDHRFQIGQLVRPRAKLLENTGIYEILRQLPSGPDGEPLYRITGGGLTRHRLSVRSEPMPCIRMGAAR
jgi:hypothetical protein